MDPESSVDIYADLLEENTPTEIHVPVKEDPAVLCSVAETVVGSVDETSRLTTLDLYDDLITDEGIQHQDSYQELSDRYQRALNTINELERQLQTARNHERFYLEKSQTLEKNISLLYVTAKAELQRKDTQIEELREDLKSRSFRWKPGCSRFHRNDFLTEEGHARSNGHSVNVGTSEKDIHQKRESYMSPRKRKIVTSWDDLKDNFKKRQKRDEPRIIAADASSSRGLHIYSEKSRDGLISARKLVEKSKKDLRNRRSNEYKKSLMDHSESVINGDLPGEDSCEVISKSEPSANITAAECNENRSGSEKVNETKDKDSVHTFKGLINSITEVGKPQIEKLSNEQVCWPSKTDLSCSEVGQLLSKDKHKEHSPCRSRKETSRSAKDRHRIYSEKKKSGESERHSHERQKADEKERPATSQTKVSSISADSSRRRASEYSRRNSKVMKDSELKSETEMKAKSCDLRYKLQQKKRIRSNEKEKPSEQQDVGNIKRCKADRTKSDQKEKLLNRFPERKPSSPKVNKLQVQEKSKDTTSNIEKVWSLVKSDTSKYSQKTSSSNDFQNVSNKMESESTDTGKAMMIPDTSWNAKKPLTPKQSSRRLDKTSVSEISSVEEDMIRVNEEKISMYSKASNKEVETLLNKAASGLNKDISQANKEDPTVCLSSRKFQEENKIDKITQASSEKRKSKSPSGRQDDKHCTAVDKDPANVFIEELLSIDQRNENFFSDEKDLELGVTQTKSDSPQHCMEDKSKDDECHKILPDVHDGSLSCFDIKIHVSETELNDLLGNEESLSGGVTSIQPSHSKKEIVKDLKLSSGGQSKYSSHMESSRNSKKKTSTTEKDGSKTLRQENEPLKSKAVLKLPLGSKQVFSESVVFENTQKPKILSEKVFVSCKGTKIVMKSEALKADEKKPLSNNSLSKKEYDADREFLNQLKTKYSKEQSKICQKKKDESKSSQSDTEKMSEICQKQTDDLKDSQIDTVSEVEEVTKKNSACTIENTEEQRKTAEKVGDSKADSIFNNEVGTNVEEAKISRDQISNHSKESSLKFGNVTEACVEKSMAKVAESFLGKNSSSSEAIDLGNLSQENYMASESIPTKSICIGDKSYRETKEMSVPLEQPLFQNPAFSIDFIRNSIIKKIEEKSKVCDDTNTANSVTDYGLQGAPEQSMPVKDSMTRNIVKIDTGTLCQDQDVQSYTMPASPDGQKVGNICRKVHTETESITEFFDEESQLDLKVAVSLRAKDGIHVRRQSFEKQNEEAGGNICSLEEKMDIDVEAAETGNNIEGPLKDSDPEEGEVYSSDSENEDQKDKEKVTRKKRSSLQNAHDEESGSRTRHSLCHRSKSGSKEKHRKDGVEDRSIRSGTETEKSLKPKTPRRDSERKYDPKEDKKEREYRTKEKSPSSSRSRERKNDDRRRESDSKHLISRRYSRTSERSVEANRHNSSATVSDRHDTSRRDASETKEVRHSRFRNNSSETKSDRHSRKPHDSSDTKSVHRNSSKASRDSSSHKSSVRRK